MILVSHLELLMVVACDQINQNHEVIAVAVALMNVEHFADELNLMMTYCFHHKDCGRRD